MSRVGYHNKLLTLSMWTRKDGGGITNRRDGRQRSGGGGWDTGARDRPCFLGLPLPRPEPGVRLVISDLYNIYKIENIRYVLTR